MTALKRPQYLKAGDVIGIAAPARKVSPEELAPAIALFESWGLRVKLPEDLFCTDNQFAGSDAVRAGVMQQLLDDEEVRAIVCARGGYGSVRIVDRLDFAAFAAHPKWVVGYSDVTVLHSHIHAHCGVETLHATMPINIPGDAREVSYPAVESMRKALFGEAIAYQKEATAYDRKGCAQGTVVGGNLSILYSLCGSPSAVDTKGKILFIEDLDEYLYHIDRMVQNLKRNGLLAGLAGLVVGQMSDMHDNTIPFGHSAEEIVREAVCEYDYPVCFGFPAGHNGMDNHALVLGRRAELRVGEDVSLIFET